MTVQEWDKYVNKVAKSIGSSALKSDNYNRTLDANFQKKRLSEREKYERMCKYVDRFVSGFKRIEDKFLSERIKIINQYLNEEYV